MIKEKSKPRLVKARKRLSCIRNNCKKNSRKKGKEKTPQIKLHQGRFLKSKYVERWWTWLASYKIVMSLCILSYSVFMLFFYFTFLCLTSPIFSCPMQPLSLFSHLSFKHVPEKIFSDHVCTISAPPPTCALILCIMCQSQPLFSVSELDLRLSGEHILFHVSLDTNPLPAFIKLSGTDQNIFTEIKFQQNMSFHQSQHFLCKGVSISRKTE